MNRLINDNQAVMNEDGTISYGQDAVNAYIATLTNQERAEAGVAEDPNQIAAHQPMGWDELRNSAGQGLGDYYKFQPLAVNGPSDWNNYLANFESNYVKQTDGGNVLNRPWNYDADTQKQGQWLLNDFNTRYGGNKTFADLPNTQWGNSLPANHKESLMGGFMNSAFPMIGAGAFGALGGAGALGLTGANGLINTGMGWLDNALLAAGKGGLTSLIQGQNPLGGALSGGVGSAAGGALNSFGGDVFSGIGQGDWFNVGGNTPINSAFDSGKPMDFSDLFGGGGDNWWDQSSFGTGDTGWWNSTPDTNDFLGDPTPGNAFNLGNSGSGNVPFNNSTFGGNNGFGNAISNIGRSLLNGDGSINWENLLRGGLGAIVGSQTRPNVTGNSLPPEAQQQLMRQAMEQQGNYNQAQGLQSATMSGQFLDPSKNPAIQGQLQQLGDQYAHQALPSVMSSAYKNSGMSGPLGENSTYFNPSSDPAIAGGGQLNSLQQQFGRGAGQILSQGYQAERTNQQNAMNSALTNFNSPSSNAISQIYGQGRNIYGNTPVGGAIGGLLGGLGSGNQGGSMNGILGLLSGQAGYAMPSQIAGPTDLFGKNTTTLYNGFKP